MKPFFSFILAVSVAAASGAARAAPDRPPPAAPAPRPTVAVLGLEALGMAPEPVARLESLFRREVERLTGQRLQSRRYIDETIRGSPQLRRCNGDNRCLAAIGRKLAVALIISGSVAELGDTYLINIKVVDTRTGEQRKRIERQPPRGDTDSLIETVRVAAYSLLAPDELVGSITVLTDLYGARVSLDGTLAGVTPLAEPLSRVTLGEHRLSVEARGYLPFAETVAVRFQKTSQVLVRLATQPQSTPLVTELPATRGPTPWYTSTWAYVGAGLTAGLVGAYLGYRWTKTPIIDCSDSPSRCSSP